MNGVFFYGGWVLNRFGSDCFIIRGVKVEV